MATTFTAPFDQLRIGVTYDYTMPHWSGSCDVKIEDLNGKLVVRFRDSFHPVALRDIHCCATFTEKVAA